VTPAGHETWAAAVGASVAVDGHEPWTVTDCTPPADQGGWRGWSVTLHSPEAVGQGTVVVHLPGAEPEPVFVVPTARDERGTTLVATFSHPLESDGTP
jgi:hypothetical protein